MARDAGENEAFGQQLPHHPQAAGAERGTHGDLALASFGAREQQVRDVRAGDEQEERDRAEQQPDRAADRSDDFVGQRQRRPCRTASARGYSPSSVIARAMPCSSSAACCTVTPGFRRAAAYRPWLP